MKPFIIALLGTAALALPGVASAQTTTGQSASSTTPTLDCPDPGPEDGATPTADGTDTPDVSGFGQGGTRGTPTATPTGTPTGTPNTPSTPGSTPTPTDDGTTTPDVSGFGQGGTTSGGGATSGTRYVTSPDVSRMTSRIERDELGVRTVYTAAGYVSGYPHANVATRKTYTRPTNGLIRTIGGQPIAVASTSVDTDFQPRIVNIIDELVLVARAVGVHDPIITSGTDGQHTVNSIHGRGLAVDLRANDMSAAQAKAYTIALKNALGPGYDVLFEDWHGGNTHIHVEYDGHTP